MLRALLIVACLSTAVVAADIEVLLPEASEQVTYINVKRMVASPLVKAQLMNEIKAKLKDTEVPKWLQEMGIDPWKDVDTMAMMMVPPKPVEGEDGKIKPVKQKFLAVIRGTFDGEKVLAAAEKAISKFGDKVSMVQDGKLKIVKFTTGNEAAVYATLADEKTMILAMDQDDLKAAVKKADEPDAKHALKKELTDLIKSLDDKAVFYQAMMLDGAEIARGIGANPLFEDTETLKTQVTEITCYSITVRVGTDVAIEFSTGMKSKESAAAFAETGKAMVEKGRTLLPLAAAGAPEFAGIINDLKKSLKVTADGTTVKLTAKITGDAIGTALGVDE